MEYRKRFSRRVALLLLGALLLPALAACAAPAAQPTAPPTAAPAATPTTAAPAATPTSAAKPAASNLGTADNPIKMAFVPSSDSQKVLATGEPLARQLEEITGLKFRVSVPTSYAAVIEAMGSNQVDVAWLAPFSYVIAHDKFGAEVILSSVRMGSKTYFAQIIVPADSEIKSVAELKGKRFAFVDAASASGYLYPSALLLKNGVDPKKDLGQTTFAGGHDKVVIAVYNKQVDAGATFGDSVPNQNPPTDARTRVRSTLPDVMEKVRVLAVTEPIPNDTVSVRKGLDPALVAKVKDGLLKLQGTEQGKKYLRDLYQIDGLAEASDKDYDGLRAVARSVGFDFEETIKPKS